MPIPLSLGDHIALDAYEARLARLGWAARSYRIGRTLGCALACAAFTIAVHVAQIGGAL